MNAHYKKIIQQAVDDAGEKLTVKEVNFCKSFSNLNAGLTDRQRFKLDSIGKKFKLKKLDLSDKNIFGYFSQSK